MKISEQINNSTQRWKYLTNNLIKPTLKFELITELYENNYKNQHDFNKNSSDKNLIIIKPTWFPTEKIIENSNIKMIMSKLNFKCYHDFYMYSIHQPEKFWDNCINSVGIQFNHPYSHVFKYDNDRSHDSNHDIDSSDDKCREKNGMLFIII